jgi:putative ABC transport system permease protein
LLGASAFMAVLGALPQPDGFDMPHIVPSSAAIAITALSMAGIVAGLYPARKAALMAPVEALRQE